jgi:hypothetical protein
VPARSKTVASPPASDVSGRHAFAEALALGDRHVAFAALRVLQDQGSDQIGELVASCQAALVFELDGSDPIVQRIQQWSNAPSAEVADGADVAEATCRALASTGRERADWQERAAQAMLRQPVPELTVASAAILAEATWQLDGIDAAEHLLQAMVGEQSEAGVPVAALRTRFAAAKGDWVAVLESAEPCIQADPSIAAKVRTDWLHALGRWWDRPAAMRQLLALPPALQDGQSDALLACLQFAGNDAAAASASWDRALSRGWTQFDPAFIRALPNLTLKPSRLQELTEVRTDREDQLHAAIAGNPHTPASVLETLAQGSPDLAVAVAGNPACPEDLLNRLARRHQITIRRAVAASPNCPVEVMELLVDDPDPGVRSSIRDHPRCPEELRIHARLTL